MKAKAIPSSFDSKVLTQAEYVFEGSRQMLARTRLGSPGGLNKVAQKQHRNVSPVNGKNGTPRHSTLIEVNLSSSSSPSPSSSSPSVSQSASTCANGERTKGRSHKLEVNHFSEEFSGRLDDSKPKAKYNTEESTSASKQDNSSTPTAMIGPTDYINYLSDDRREERNKTQHRHRHTKKLVKRIPPDAPTVLVQAITRETPTKHRVEEQRKTTAQQVGATTLPQTAAARPGKQRPQAKHHKNRRHNNCMRDKSSRSSEVGCCCCF